MAHSLHGSRRGDSLTNILLFLTMVIAALIVVLWYVTAVRPTRMIIGSVTDDEQQIGRHISNACGVTLYNATFSPATGNARLVTNTTHYCVSTDDFSVCSAAVCAIDNATIQFGAGLLRITKQQDDIVRFGVG
jgi:hypothetical protein